MPTDEDIVDEEEFELIQQLRDAKKVYRRDFEEFKSLKASERAGSLIVRAGAAAAGGL